MAVFALANRLLTSPRQPWSIRNSKPLNCLTIVANTSSYFFYPLDFTFVCPTEITAFSDRHIEFKDLNTEVLGVSVDSEFSHLAWIQTERKMGGIGDLNYPLVSDIKKEVSAAYNVLDPDAGVALRGLFILDKEGVIQHSTVNNLSFGRSVDETLRVLQAIQHVQAHPEEVCPVDWQPGEKTMNPDPVKSKDFFRRRVSLLATGLSDPRSL